MVWSRADMVAEKEVSPFRLLQFDVWVHAEEAKKRREHVWRLSSSINSCRLCSYK